MYRLVLKKSAEKSLQQIDKRFQQRIVAALKELRVDPLLGKPLKGELAGFYTVRVWPYRIIYTIYRMQLTVYVVAIEHRQGAYK